MIIIFLIWLNFLFILDGICFFVFLVDFILIVFVFDVVLVVKGLWVFFDFLVLMFCFKVEFEIFILDVDEVFLVIIFWFKDILLLCWLLSVIMWIFCFWLFLNVFKWFVSVN